MAPAPSSQFVSWLALPVGATGAGSFSGVRAFGPGPSWLGALSPGRRGVSIRRNVRRLARSAYPYAAALLGMLPALAAAACDWSRPGAAPYRGPGDITAASAVESYTDIPAEARADLAQRIRSQREDAIVLITRDGITSPQGTATGLRDMHWRGGLCTGPVTRAGWAPQHVEAALVYCSGPHCVAVPVVCGNVARLDFTFREPPTPELRMWDGRPVQVRTVPEPSSLALVAVALVALRRGLA